MNMADYRSCARNSRSSQTGAADRHRNFDVCRNLRLGPSAGNACRWMGKRDRRIDPTGTVTVLTGASPHGQGQETSFAQIAADEWVST